MKKKLVLGMLGLGACIALAGCGVEQTASEITVEAGSELHVHASDFLSVDSSKDHDVEIDASTVDTSKVGEYELTATYKKDTYTLKVIVVDTVPPEVTMNERILYTADMAEADLINVVGEVKDASEYEMSIAGYEKVGTLEELNDEYVATLEESVKEVTGIEGMETEIPSELGVYRGVVSFKDTSSNESFEEIYIVYDTGTGEETDDDEVQEVDTKEDTKTDNKSDKGTTSKDASKNTNKNTSSTSKDTNKGTTNTDTKKPTNTSSSNSNSGTTSNNSSGSSANTTKDEVNNNGSTNSSDNSANNTTKNEESNSDDKEETPNMTPSQSTVVNAGYYTVVEIPAGGYGVLVKSADEAAKGRELIESYLDSIGYERIGSIRGGWIDPDKGQYAIFIESSNIQKKS